MAMDDLEHETIRDRLHALKNGRHHAGHAGGNGGGFFEGIERRVRGLETWQLLLGGVVLVGVVDHLIAPKGMSFASKALDKLGATKPALPPPPPPPPALTPVQVAARGDWTGANAQAGWNRGMSPYGGWALNAPAGPWPYAHAGQHYSWGAEYPWAQ